MNTTRCTLFLAISLGLGFAPSLAQDPGPHDHHGAAEPSAVHLTTVDYAFELPDALPSGWNTFTFTNQGEEIHFVLFVHLPEGKTMRDYEQEIYPVFGRAYQALVDGEVDQQGAIGILMENAPEWFFQTQFMGGAGLSSPGVTSEVTVNLLPGDYVVECYMKTAEGLFHVMEGMARPLRVTDEASHASPPAATVNVSLSNSGIAIDGDVTPGRHTVAVHWAENPEHGFSHDLNIVRVDADTPVSEVVDWMNWMNPGGLMPPYPGTFVGGARPMPAGSTAYFTVDLEPGRYVLVSENTGPYGVVKELTVRSD